MRREGGGGWQEDAWSFLRHGVVPAGCRFSTFSVDKSRLLRRPSRLAKDRSIAAHFLGTVGQANQRRLPCSGDGRASWRAIGGGAGGVRWINGCRDLRGVFWPTGTGVPTKEKKSRGGVPGAAGGAGGWKSWGCAFDCGVRLRRGGEGAKGSPGVGGRMACTNELLCPASASGCPALTNLSVCRERKAFLLLPIPPRPGRASKRGTVSLFHLFFK